MQKINIMGIRSSVILNKFDHNLLIMEPITQKQEEMIDSSESTYGEILYITKNNIKIPARDIFLYGEINIKNPDDISLLRKSDIITQNVNQAANIPSNFDYTNGDVYSDKDDVIKTHDTWNKIDWFKFNHCLIGKPERIIIYRINKAYVKRNRSTRRNNVCSEL